MPQHPKAVLYNGLEIEIYTIRIGKGKLATKIAFDFNQSLQHLQEQGFQRHLFAREGYNLICAGLEGKLNGKAEDAFKDMQFAWQEEKEFCDEFLLRHGDSLYCFEQPRRLIVDENFDHGEYDYTNMAYAHRYQFSLKGLVSKDNISLADVAKKNPALARHFYSRDFGQLPPEIRERASLSFPKQGDKRGSFAFLNRRFQMISFLEHGVYGASRGVIDNKPTKPRVWRDFKMP